MTNITKISYDDFQTKWKQIADYIDNKWSHPIYERSQEFLDEKEGTVNKIPLAEFEKLDRPLITEVDERLAQSEKERIESALVSVSNSDASGKLTRMSVSMCLSYHLVPTFTPTIFQTDGMRIQFNPHCTKLLADNQVVPPICHEFAHILLDDVGCMRGLLKGFSNILWDSDEDARAGSIAKSIANLFIDPIVDQYTLDHGQSTLMDMNFIQDHWHRCATHVSQIAQLCLSTGASTGDIVCDAKFQESPENFYEWTNSQDKWAVLTKLSLLIARAVDFPEDDGKGAGGEGDGDLEPNPGIGDIDADADESDDTLASKREAAVESAAKHAGVESSNFLLQLPEPVPSNKIDDHLPEVMSKIYDDPEQVYSTIDPTMAGLNAYLPVDDEPPMAVAVALDVSGSVVYSEEDFALLLGELTSSLEHPKIAAVMVVPFDAGAPNPENVRWLENGEDIQHKLADIAGGGGTDFTPAFQFIEDHDRVDEISCVIMLTDGYAGCDVQPDWQLPRIWISTEADTQGLDQDALAHVLLENRKRGGVNQ